MTGNSKTGAKPPSTGLRDRAAELLPCPFCGPGQSMCDPYFNDMAKRWQVGCGRCGCSTGTCRTKEAAIKAWNIRALLASHAPAAPIPMVIRCPHCHAQHIDKPEPGLMNWGGEPDSGLHRGWDNPPHTSHLCHNCGAIWRDCSVETTGVESVPPGKHDRPPTNAPAGAEGWVLVPKEPTEEMLVAGAKAMAGPSPKGPQYCNGVPRIYAAMLDASPAQAATVHRCAMCNEVIPPGTICSRLRGALYHHECAEKLPFTGKHDAPVMIKLAASPAPSPATPPAEARDLVERYARAICTARGHGPETLHQVVDPTDYADTSDSRGYRFIYGWRKWVAAAEAVLALPAAPEARGQAAFSAAKNCRRKHGCFAPRPCNLVGECASPASAKTAEDR